MRMISRGAQQTLGNEEGAQHVIGDHPAGIADHVRVAFFEAQHAARFKSCVHADDHGGSLAGRQRGFLLWQNCSA